MAYSKNKLSANIILSKIIKKISISSNKRNVLERAEKLAQELGLENTQDVFQKLLDQRIRKTYGGKSKMLESCDCYEKLKNEVTSKVKYACEGNISKALVEDLLKECERHEI